MVARLIRCLKGWGTGVFILGFPMLFFNGDFYFGGEKWKTFVSVLLVFFPVLLLFEFLFTRLLFVSKSKQLVALVFILIISEIIFFYLPLNLTQVKYLGNWITIASLLLFVIIAAIFILRILFPHKNLIIVQKEI